MVKEIEKVKKIYIASTFKGNNEKNVLKAKHYCYEVIRKGHIPFAPHVMYHSILDDSIPYEQKLELELGKEILKNCDEVWVYGSVSKDLKEEIKLANEFKIPVFFMEEPKLEFSNLGLEPGTPVRFMEDKNTYKAVFVSETPYIVTLNKGNYLVTANKFALFCGDEEIEDLSKREKLCVVPIRVPYKTSH